MQVISNLFKNEILFHPHLFHVVIRLSLFWRIKPKYFWFSLSASFQRLLVSSALIKR